MRDGEREGQRDILIQTGRERESVILCVYIYIISRDRRTDRESGIDRYRKKISTVNPLLKEGHG